MEKKKGKVLTHKYYQLESYGDKEHCLDYQKKIVQRESASQFVCIRCLSIWDEMWSSPTRGTKRTLCPICISSLKGTSNRKERGECSKLVHGKDEKDCITPDESGGW